jgi:hypothetical protein
MKSRSKKASTSSEENFLNAAARAVGSTLGKLATKTGLAGSGDAPSGRNRATRKKRAVATKAAAKRKPAAKKTTAKRGQR